MTYSTHTRVFTLDPRQPDPAAIAEAARVLQRGGLVAFPTETVYGLGANALDAEAVSRIFAAKGRPASDPVIVHIAAIAQIDHIARDVPPLAYTLAEQFWPGPLTLVLRRNDAVPANVAAGGPSVGVRMPRHPVALALLEASRLPVAAPSANLFARPSPTTARHVLDDLNGRVDVVLDAGATQVGVESTVLDLTGPLPRLLRPGGVSLEHLRALMPDIELVTRYLREDESAAGPGMLLRHYAPRAPMTLYTGAREPVLAAMRDRAAELSHTQRVGLLLPDEDATFFDTLAVDIVTLGASDDLEGVASRLFAALRELDARGVEIILARGLAQTGLGLAIRDRMVRAAEGRVVEL